MGNPGGLIGSYQRQMEQFLQAAATGQNVVLEADFKKYLPLFNRESLSRLTNQEAQELMYEYNTTFDLTCPIHVISPELDEKNGIVYIGFENRQGDGLKHKVLMTFPPARRRLKTMNQLGVSLDAIDMVAGGLQHNNPQSPTVRTGVSELNKIAESIGGPTEEEQALHDKLERELLNPEEVKKEQEAASSDDPEELDAVWN